MSHHESPAMNTTPAQTMMELADTLDEAKFLVDRLGEYDPEDEDHVRDYHGHVTPSLMRLSRLLAARPQAEGGDDGEAMDDFIRAVLADNNPRSDEPYATVAKWIRKLRLPPRTDAPAGVVALVRELCGDELNGGFVRNLCFTVWNICHNPTHKDGNADWGNDTLPTVQKAVSIIRDKLRALSPPPGVVRDAGREDVVWLREVDAGTDNACWVISNRVDPDAVPFFAALTHTRPERSPTENKGDF